MKKKYAILSLFFPFLVLSAILLHSFHEIHHLEDFLTEKHCHHQYNHSKTELHHAHHDIEHCPVCDLTITKYSGSASFTFSLKRVSIFTPCTFYCYKTTIQSFKGSLFLLRAPPAIIV